MRRRGHPGRRTRIAWAALTLVCSVSATVAGCKSNNSLSDTSSGGGGGGIIREDGGGSSSGGSSGAGSTSSGGGPDASGHDAAVDVGGEASPEASGALDASDAAPGFDGGGLADGAEAGTRWPPYDGGFDPVCETPLAWWATTSSFDGTVTPASFSSQINPLLAQPNEFPMTFADYQGDGGAWMLRASASETNGSFQQYFPVAYPLTDVPMNRTTNTFASASAGTGWLKVVDAAQKEVWIQLDQVLVEATYADGACQTLTNGSVSAVVDAASASTAITTGSGATTIGALLGPQTSSSPAGWTVVLTFMAQKVQVSFK